MKNYLVNLHIHTTASDGTSTPKVLIEEIKQHHIDVFSVTDHDSISNVKRIAELAMKKKLVFIPGIEISTMLDNQYYHILGYGIDIENSVLLKLLQEIRKSFDIKDHAFINNLENSGYPVKLQEYLASNESEIGGWKLLNYIIDKKICADINDFFSKFPTGGIMMPFPKLPSPETAIKIIKESKGVAILAHPGNQIFNSLHELLEEFLLFGIDGVECFHPQNNQEIAMYSNNWCRKKNLITTSGSDYHGTFGRNKRLDYPVTYLRELNLGPLQRYLNDS